MQHNITYKINTSTIKVNTIYKYKTKNMIKFVWRELLKGGALSILIVCRWSILLAHCMLLKCWRFEGICSWNLHLKTHTLLSLLKKPLGNKNIIFYFILATSFCHELLKSVLLDSTNELSMKCEMKWTRFFIMFPMRHCSITIVPPSHRPWLGIHISYSYFIFYTQNPSA